MKTKVIIILTITLPVIFLDQVSKLWIEQNLTIFQSIQIVQNFFHITYIRNTGGAFGILSGLNSACFQKIFIFVALVAIGIIGLLYYKLRAGQYRPAIGIALIIGGAIGNLIDRIRLGEVIDFIDLHFYSYHWPAFNVADSAITIGSFVLGACILLKKW
ncbi:MAG: signal peptidase II [Deltaproteobacteria bacterium]|nr:signal peptidase II [Deltaproteobacteria bacterium]